jgi:Protein of unknown function (DUF3108)
MLKISRVLAAILLLSQGLSTAPTARGLSTAYIPPAFENFTKAPATPFALSEELVFEGEFSRALLRGIDIAELRFVSEFVNEGPDHSPLLSYRTEVLSKGALLKLFGVSFRQLLESRVLADTHSLLSNTKLDEQGKRKRQSETVVDARQKKLTWTEHDLNNPDREPRVVVSNVNGSVHDAASAIYYIRSRDLSPGKSFNLTVSDSGRVGSIPITVFEKKPMKTVLGKVQTVRVEAGLFGEGRMISGKGSIFIWFTDDPRHIPVKARINNSLGTLDIKLKSVKHSDSTPSPTQNAQIPPAEKSLQ